MSDVDLGSLSSPDTSPWDWEYLNARVRPKPDKPDDIDDDDDQAVG